MSAAAVRQFTVGGDDDGIRLDRWFQRHLPEASFNTVSRWARTGQLRLDGARAKPDTRIVSGQVIRVPPAETAVAAPRPVRMRTELSSDQVDFAKSLVIHRDAAAIVLNKPPGLATQGGSGTTEHVDGLLDALTFEAEGRPKLVHRLDKDTSGALLIARNARAAAHFAKAFSSRTARKVYWAIVVGVPDIADGMIELPIGKQPGTGGEKMHVDAKEGSPARTRYRVVDRVGNRAAWVELQPYTGRTHQLRVHMAAIGHPIVGDGKYGGKEAFLTGTISRKMHLHARRLKVDHPDGGTIDMRAELPEHFAATMHDLGFEAADGDALPLETPKFSETPEGRKRLVANKAKAARKERKGERRSRGDALMHPNPAFRFADEVAMRAFVERHAFAHLFAATPEGPMVAHLPLTPAHGGTFRFHLARYNRIAAHLDGATVLASVAGADGYVSPDWYAEPRDQVPTWNYAAVEIEGTAHALVEADLVEQIDALSHIHETRLSPKPVWTRDKVSSEKLAAMYRAIQCFELRPTAIRGTCKYSQNKSEADRAGVIAALGRAPLGRAMEAAR